MRHPTLDYQKLEEILALIPKGTPWLYVLYTYIVVAMKKNHGNRIHTSKDIKMPIRSLRYKFGAMEVLGFEIPKHESIKKIA